MYHEILTELCFQRVVYGSDCSRTTCTYMASFVNRRRLQLSAPRLTAGVAVLQATSGSGARRARRRSLRRQQSALPSADGGSGGAITRRLQAARRRQRRRFDVHQRRVVIVVVISARRQRTTVGTAVADDDEPESPGAGLWQRSAQVSLVHCWCCVVLRRG